MSIEEWQAIASSSDGNGDAFTSCSGMVFLFEDITAEG